MAYLQVFHLVDKKTEFQVMELIGSALIVAVFVRNDIIEIAVRVEVFLSLLEQIQKTLILREQCLKLFPPIFVIQITNL